MSGQCISITNVLGQFSTDNLSWPGGGPAPPAGPESLRHVQRHSSMQVATFGHVRKKVIASFQIAKGGERRHVMCVGERSGLNPGPLGYRALRAANCARYTYKLEIEFKSHCYTGQLQFLKFFSVLRDSRCRARPTARDIW